MGQESTIVFSGTTIFAGHFRCPSNHALWSEENQIRHFPTIVFPRVAVGIHQTSRPLVIAMPNHVMLYNAFQTYQRYLIDPRGDICEFIGVPGQILAEAARSMGFSLESTANAPFEHSYAPCSDRLYLRQRALFQLLATRRDVDSLYVEESFLNLVHELMEATLRFQNSPLTKSPIGGRVHREQVTDAKEFIGRNFCQPLKIDDVAESAGCSPFHLCRIFKEFTGLTVHRFWMQYRLRNSIERLLESDRSLIDIALDLGFSSHSHFTNAFRKTFGISPSQLRKSRSLAVLANDP